MQHPYDRRRLTAEYLDSLDTRTGERTPHPRATRWQRAQALLLAAALLALLATAAYKEYIAFAKF